MTRISYEMVAVLASRLITKTATSRSQKEINFYWREYVTYLEACGWSVKEFEDEMMRRIDMSWDDKQWD